MSLYLRDRLNLSATVSLAPACSLGVQFVYGIRFILLSVQLYMVITPSIVYKMYRKGVNYCIPRQERKRAEECQGFKAETQCTTDKTLFQIIFLVIVTHADDDPHHLRSDLGRLRACHGDACVPLSSQWRLPVIPPLVTHLRSARVVTPTSLPSQPGPGRQDAAQSTQQRI